jgi:hypothetical protein
MHIALFVFFILSQFSVAAQKLEKEEELIRKFETYF